MDIEQTANAITRVVITLLQIVLGIYLVIKLPLWTGLMVFCITSVVTITFLGPAVAIAAFIVALTIQGIAWISVRRRTRS